MILLSIPRPSGKVTTRSFRIDTEWEKAISEIAKEKGISTSALIEQICCDYVLFYQWVEKLGSIILSPNTIMPIIVIVGNIITHCALYYQ